MASELILPKHSAKLTTLPTQQHMRIVAAFGYASLTKQALGKEGNTDPILCSHWAGLEWNERTGQYPIFISSHYRIEEISYQHQSKVPITYPPPFHPATTAYLPYLSSYH